MDWLQALAYIMEIAMAGNSLMSENTTQTETPAQAGGQAPASPGPFAQPDQLNQTLAGLMGGGPMVPTVDQATQAAAQAGRATQQASQMKPVDTKVPTGKEQKTGESKEVSDGNTPPTTGEILAAIPQALAAVDMLFNQQAQATQRPAPIAGAPGGQVVGQFAQPYGGPGNNIGQLLAALPGIR